MSEPELEPQPVAGERPPRVATQALKVAVAEGEGARWVPVRNLSLTGLYLPTLTVPVGREVPLLLPLPGEARPLRVTGRVVRQGPEGGVGLVFSEIGWDALLAVARFLAPRI